MLVVSGSYQNYHIGAVNNQLTDGGREGSVLRGRQQSKYKGIDEMGGGGGGVYNPPKCKKILN
jgi:hypothetical protein